MSSDLHMCAIECAAKHVHSVHSLINKWILLKFEYSKPSKSLSKSNGTVNWKCIYTRKCSADFKI